MSASVTPAECKILSELAAAFESIRLDMFPWTAEQTEGQLSSGMELGTWRDGSQNWLKALRYSVQTFPTHWCEGSSRQQPSISFEK